MIEARPGLSQVRTPPMDQKVAASMRRALTTKPDHNGTRRGPIPADAGEALPQVSDCLRQSGRILQVRVPAIGQEEAAGRSCHLTVSAGVWASKCGHPWQRIGIAGIDSPRSVDPFVARRFV